LICGQSITEASTAAPKDKEPRTLLIRNLARLSPLHYIIVHWHGGLQQQCLNSLLL